MIKRVMGLNQKETIWHNFYLEKMPSFIAIESRSKILCFLKYMEGGTTL